MEKKNLIYLSKKIYNYINDIQYDQTVDFLAFKTDMLMNMDKFLSPEKYDENIEILRENNVEFDLCEEPIATYLERLNEELILLLVHVNMPYDDQMKKTFEIDKFELIRNISDFLDPYMYKGNFKALNKLEKRKRIELK